MNGAGQKSMNIPELLASLKNLASSSQHFPIVEKRNILNYFAVALGLQEETSEIERYVK